MDERPQSNATIIRERARHSYVEPAVKRGERSITIVAGDVVRDLNLVNRVPAVCSALTSKAFLAENNLVLEKREGPPSGQSTTMRYTYRLVGAPNADSARARFLAIRGIAKGVYRKLGGGEEFLRKERDEMPNL
jgi:hypothetical protein